MSTIDNYLRGDGKREEIKEQVFLLAKDYNRLGKRYYWPGRFIVLLGECLQDDILLHDHWLHKDHFHLYGFDMSRSTPWPTGD